VSFRPDSTPHNYKGKEQVVFAVEGEEFILKKDCDYSERMKLAANYTLNVGARAPALTLGASAYPYRSSKREIVRVQELT
jgi:hypothetical protein